MIRSKMLVVLQKRRKRNIVNVRLEKDLSEFTSTVTDSGDLSWSENAAMAGSFGGMQGVIDDNVSIFGAYTLGTPNTSGTLRFRFYYDTNGLTMIPASTHYIANCKTTTSSGNDLCEVALLRSGDGLNFAISAGIYNDTGATSFTNATIITDEPHCIEVLLKRASNNVASNGYLSLWIDGNLIETISGKDNYDRFVSFGYIKVGATYGVDATTSGTFYLDELVVNDDGAVIGPTIS